MRVAAPRWKRGWSRWWWWRWRKRRRSWSRWRGWRPCPPAPSSGWERSAPPSTASSPPRNRSAPHNRTGNSLTRYILWRCHFNNYSRSAPHNRTGNSLTRNILWHCHFKLFWNFCQILREIRNIPESAMNSVITSLEGQSTIVFFKIWTFCWLFLSLGIASAEVRI